MLQLLNNGMQFIQCSLVEGVHWGVRDHQQRDLVVVIEAVGFDTDIAPGLNDLPRFGEAAKVAPLGNSALNLFYRFGVTECGKIAQGLIEQDGAQGAAHVLTRARFRERRDHQKIRWHGGGAFFGADQILQSGQILIG